MARGKKFTVIDIGTHTIVCLHGRVTTNENDNSVEILASSQDLSAGIENGKIVDAWALTRALEKAITNIRKQIFTLDTVIVISSVLAPESSLRKEEIILLTQQVEKKDIDKAISRAKTYENTPNSSIFHAVSVLYTLDKKQYATPIGKNGEILHVYVNCVKIPNKTTSLLMQIFNHINLKVNSLALDSYMAGIGVLTHDDMAKNPVLVDIGAGTISIAAFFNGALASCHTIEMGSNDITKDIAVNLGIEWQEAEILKHRYGCASIQEYINGEEKIPYALQKKDAPNEERIITIEHFTSITSARVRQIFEEIKTLLVEKEITNPYVVLTGSGASMLYTTEKAQTILQRSVVFRPPYGYSNLNSRYNHTVYSASIGALRWAGTEQKSKEQTFSDTPEIYHGSLLRRIITFFIKEF